MQPKICFWKTDSKKKPKTKKQHYAHHIPVIQCVKII